MLTLLDTYQRRYKVNCNYDPDICVVYQRKPNGKWLCVARITGLSAQKLDEYLWDCDASGVDDAFIDDGIAEYVGEWKYRQDRRR